jgi:hypothetical protein
VVISLQQPLVSILQQFTLGTASQQRGKWSAHYRMEHRLRGMLLPYFRDGIVQRRMT